MGRIQLASRLRLAVAVGIVLFAPCNAGAQTPERVYRVGFIGTSPSSSAQPAAHLQPLRDALRQRGWIDGQNLSLVFRFHEGKRDRIPVFLDEFIRGRMDVILTVTDPVTAAAARATHTIPIVIVTGAEPVRLGVAESLAHPRGNVTGALNFAGPEVFGKHVQFLKETRPQIKRLTILWDTGPSSPHLEAMSRAAQTLGMETRVRPIHDKDDLETALTTLTSERPDAMFVLAASVNWVERKRIVEWALKHRVPTMAEIEGFARAGLLMSYSFDFDDQLRRVAEFVDKILRGAKPGDLPIEQPTKFKLVVNRKTATAIGVSIPPSVLLRADEVIE